MTDLTHINQALLKGGICILPTETVYGLAADAASSAAIDKIYTIKGRKFSKPLALCVKDLPMAENFGHFSPLAKKLAAQFWPGPLSIVVPSKKETQLDSRLLGLNAQGEPTISLRCPDSNWRKTIDIMPLALTSANKSGEPDSLTAKAAKSAIGDDVDAILDGPDCNIGLASTIIAVKDKTARLLRAGSVKAEDFRQFDIEWI